MSNSNNKKSKSGESVQSFIPGISEFIESQKAEEEVFFSGQKNEKYFDAAELPDVPDRQANANGATTYVMYALFPSQEMLVRALNLLTGGYRKSLKAGDKFGSLNAVAKMPNDPAGRTFLEFWEDTFAPSGKGRKSSDDDEEDEDEAQAPI